MSSTKNYFIALSAILWFQSVAVGQQTPLFPEYNYNPFLINPAYAGMAPGPVASAGHTRFTRNIDGAPTTSSLSYHLPISAGKMGMGAAIIDDRIGVMSATSAVLAYSYKIYFDLKRDRPYWEVYDQNVLSFGMTVGMKRLHENLLELGVPEDPEFATNLSETIPTIGAGLLYNRVGFYLGVSVPDLLGGRFASRDDLKLSTPIYGYAGYRFFTDLYKEIMVTPSTLVKYEAGAPVQIDMNLSVNFKSKFELGAGYRSSTSLNVITGIYPAEQLRVVYHYTIGLKRPTLGNHHGLILSYAFGYQ